MGDNDGKRLYSSYEEADRDAAAMRARFKKPFQPYKTAGGWEVGGVHVKSKTPYKRVKSFSDIRALFDEISESISEADLVNYANEIAAESASSKVSEVNGDGENWQLVSWEVLTGYELNMNNPTPYLVLTVSSGSKSLNIKMGGAFSKHIPLVSAQAESLCGQKIVWHTWNSSRRPTDWKPSEWFYLIERVDA